MESLDQKKLARIQELLRELYALTNDLAYRPNVRGEVEHYETLALLTGHPPPGPVVPVHVEEQRIPAADTVLVEPE